MKEPMENAAAIDRICRMERYFDCLRKTVGAGGMPEDTQLRGMLQELMEYYESGRGMEDYRLDEEGGLPPGLKRGVLSEDGVYDLLCELDEPDR